ncbi:hypothetical protein [Enterobacter hormaechei]|uniref:hypothetical protein n=1 Tax=Enterobacter hormaechei TaxID=158836 RepID=UPI0007962EF3|nr:hypothetical protein [Enterobacter hormaechei]EAO5102665.1 hypothetical protein [Salmonella enterica]EIJ5197254.1 hypothetical protein [Salmonella enterica]CZZ74818.1 Uncharacterised protein [Enterobacter hormaechei]HCT4396116.1 hypothetical protein [Escherichia coli]
MNDKTQRVTMATQSLSDAVSSSIDITPTWGEVGNIIRRLIRAGELSAFEHMEVEMARAFAACQALQAIQKDLPDDLREIACAVTAAEMAKQGFGPSSTKGKEAAQ